jgi:hypothetical protein
VLCPSWPDRRNRWHSVSLGEARNAATLKLYPCIASYMRVPSQTSQAITPITVGAEAVTMSDELFAQGDVIGDCSVADDAELFVVIRVGLAPAAPSAMESRAGQRCTTLSSCEPNLSDLRCCTSVSTEESTSHSEAHCTGQQCHTCASLPCGTSLRLLLPGRVPQPSNPHRGYDCEVASR